MRKRRNADDRLRRLERIYQQDPSKLNLLTWWRALLKAGQLPPHTKLLERREPYQVVIGGRIFDPWGTWLEHLKGWEIIAGEGIDSLLNSSIMYIHHPAYSMGYREVPEAYTIYIHRPFRKVTSLQHVQSEYLDTVLRRELLEWVEEELKYA